MKITHRIFLHLAVLTALCWSTKAVTWFEAQSICRERNLTLTLQSNESNSFYWTGFYKRISHWIKIIGCYNASTIEYETSTDLLVFSPPLCQKYCLQNNFYLFAVQRNTCLCLPASSLHYNKNQLKPSVCTYTCNDSTLLSTECGGESAFSVFLTDTTLLKIQTRCLSLQCGAVPTFDDFNCTAHLSVICSNSTIDRYMNWTDSLEYCKKSDHYLLGNIDLSNITSSCTGLYNTNNRWIGVVKEDYMSTDDGEVITEIDQLFFYLCKKCKKKDPDYIECKYVQCEESKLSAVFCTEKENLPITQDNTDGRYSESSTSSYSKESEITTNVTFGKTKSKDISSSFIAVPVCLSVLILLIGTIVTVIIIRRKKMKDSENREQPSSNACNSANYSNVETRTDNDYSVLQQPSATYQSANYSELQFESTTNSSYSDLTGNNVFIERSSNSIYYNMSSAKSDYINLGLQVDRI